MLFDILRKFRQILNRKQKGKTLNLLFIAIIGAFMEVLSVSMIFPLVLALMDESVIKTNKIVSTFCTIFNISSYRTFLLVCIIGLILLFIIKNMFLSFQTYVYSDFVYQNRFETQNRILNSIMKKPYEYFIASSSGDIIRNINDDVHQTYSLLMTLIELISTGFVSLMLCLTIFIIEPVLSGALALFLFLFVFLINRFFRPRMRKKGTEYYKNNSLSYKWILQSVNGIKEIKVANKEQFFEDNFSDCATKRNKAEKEKDVMNDIPKHLIEVCCICTTLAVSAIMIARGRDPKSLVPTLSTLGMAAMKLLPGVNRILGALNRMYYDGPALGRLINTMYETKTDKEKNISEENLTIDDVVELKKISYKYPQSDTFVLQDASMTIPVGKAVGIIGKSGEGKTTAVDILLGLLSPSSGTVTTDGKDINLNINQWLSFVGYIPQTIYIMDGSVKDNICFGSDFEEEKVWQALHEARLDDFVKTLPNGLDTDVGERGIRLSGGQRQRLGIARALYRNPKFLIFDEATSSLDMETEMEIIESVNNLHGKKTMIIIAHRLQTTEGCDIIYRVRNKTISREK